jgi:hypothetical protein
MPSQPKANGTPQTLTVRLPLTLRRYGGRKAVVVPNESQPATRRHEPLSPLVRALARAYHWQKLIETGEFSSIAELAAAEHIDKSYVSKMIRLTLLAPDIVELILKGGEPIKIDVLKQPFSIEWSAQRDALIAANVKDSRQVR